MRSLTFADVPTFDEISRSAMFTDVNRDHRGDGKSRTAGRRDSSDSSVVNFCYKTHLSLVLHRPTYCSHRSTLLANYCEEFKIFLL